MLVSFLYPFSLRNCEAPFLWVFHNQMNHIKSKDVAFILSEAYLKGYDYFKTENRWEADASFFQKDDFIVQKKYTKTVLNATRLNAIYNLFPDDLSFFEAYLTKTIPELESMLYEALADLDKNEKIEGVLSWSNCPSLKDACKRLNLEVIYNEVGPLRAPIFKSTGYFDFKGVNGGTESMNRFTNFQKRIESEQFILLENKDLLELFLTPDYLHYLSILNNYESTIYDVGLGLQVENDSNVIAYSNGFNNEKLINKYNKGTATAARKHPNGLNDYSDQILIDESGNSIEFIKKSKKIATVNSGIAMEALILGRQVEMLGDTPFLLLNSNNNSGFDDHFKKCALNFLLLNYLVPFDLLYKKEYIKFRLEEKDELIIFLYHLNYYRTFKSPNVDRIDNSNSIKEIKALKDTKVRMYFADENYLFSEEKSVFNYVTANTAQNIEFNISSAYKDTRYIRFDIGEEPGFININEISIRDTSGEILWTFSTLHLFNKLNILFIESEEYFQKKTVQLSTNNDPQFTIKLSDAIRERLSMGFIIRIKLSFLTHRDAELLNKIVIKPLSYVSESEIKDLRMQVSSFELERREKSAVINNLVVEQKNTQDYIAKLYNKLNIIEAKYNTLLEESNKKIDLLEKKNTVFENELSSQLNISANRLNEIEENKKLVDKLNRQLDNCNKEIILQNLSIVKKQEVILSENIEKNKIIAKNNELNKTLLFYEQKFLVQNENKNKNEKEIANLNISIVEITKKLTSLIDKYENKNIFQIAINRILKK